MNQRPEWICQKCGTHRDPVIHTKGYFLVELALWLLFCAPGIIYSMWRLASRCKACATCGSTDLVPVSSPRGKILMEQSHKAREDELERTKALECELAKRREEKIAAFNANQEVEAENVWGQSQEYFESNQLELAIDILKDLVRRYPSTAAASAAKKKLAQLKQ